MKKMKFGKDKGSIIINIDYIYNVYIPISFKIRKVLGYLFNLILQSSHKEPGKVADGTCVHFYRDIKPVKLLSC